MLFLIMGVILAIVTPFLPIPAGIGYLIAVLCLAAWVADPFESRRALRQQRALSRHRHPSVQRHLRALKDHPSMKDER